MARIVFHQPGWDEVVKDIIDGEGVRRMKRVAEVCNAEFHAHPDHGPEDGFKVSHEGDQKLGERDYVATVITANAPAMAHNQKHNTLVKNFYLAGGDV